MFNGVNSTSTNKVKKEKSWYEERQMLEILIVTFEQKHKKECQQCLITQRKQQEKYFDKGEKLIK